MHPAFFPIASNINALVIRIQKQQHQPETNWKCLAAFLLLICFFSHRDATLRLICRFVFSLASALLLFISRTQVNEKTRSLFGYFEKNKISSQHGTDRIEKENKNGRRY